MMSLRTYFDHCMRKTDPVDPRGADAVELAGLLSRSLSAVERCEAHMRENPALWDLTDPRDLMRELVRLPGVGKAGAAWFVLNELQVAQRVEVAA